MKHWKRMTISCGIAAVAYLCGAWVDRQVAGAAAIARAAGPQSFQPSLSLPRSPETALIPAGTRINIRLQEPFGTQQHSPGDRITALLYGPLIVDAKLLAPSRCEIVGQWIPAEEPGRLEGGGLTVLFRKRVIDGKDYALETDPLPLAVVSPDARDAADTAGGEESDLLIEAGYGGSSTPGYGIDRKEGAAAAEPVVRFSITLSSPLVLPVIRTLGRIKEEE